MGAGVRRMPLTVVSILIVMVKIFLKVVSLLECYARTSVGHSARIKKAFSQHAAESVPSAPQRRGSGAHAINSGRSKSRRPAAMLEPRTGF